MFARLRFDDQCSPKRNLTGTVKTRYKWQGNFTDTIRAFREYTYNYMGINRTQPKFQITFLNKEAKVAEHKLLWGNIDQNIQAVRKAYPSIPIRKVSWYHF